MKKIIAFIILVFCSSCILIGCGFKIERDPWDIKKEEDGWHYYVNEDANGNKYSVILGLVDEDMELDELIVPERLGGYTVKHFGTTYSSFSVGTKYYKFNAKNIHCLVFNHTLSLMPSVFDNYYGKAIFNFDISSTATFDLLRQKLFKSYIDYDGMGGEISTYALFWHVDRQIPKPEDPIRDGYVFDGWYTDDGYITEWDFNKDLIQGDMTLFAKWLER